MKNIQSAPLLYIYLIHHSWESDALADVRFAGNPGDGSLDT
jgi:hypothetical protein